MKTNRSEVTKSLSELTEKLINPYKDPRIYWAREVTFDYATTHSVRVDYMKFKPVNNTVSGIEKGDFYCFEVKSSVEDFHSKNGHNFIGDFNYYVMPEKVYAAVSLEIPYKVGVYCPVGDFGELKAVKKAKRTDRTRPVSEMLLMMFRSQQEISKNHQIKEECILDNLYIVIPAYNEEANIESVIKQWHSVVEKVGGDSKLVIINDGSKDGTEEKILLAEEEYPRLVGINKVNEGHGATILRGYEYAIASGADYIFQTDSDGQTLPEEFWQFWERREECGLLIGYRKGRQDGLSRIFVTRTLRLVLFVIFKVWVKDANTPFRLMNAKQLSLVLQPIPKGYNLSNVIMTIIYKKWNLGVEYIPITFRPRQGGKNSINMRKIFGIGRQALKDFRYIRKEIAKANHIAE